MKILFINSVCGIGSTGRICTDLAKEYEKQGHQVKIAYGRDGSVPEQYREYAIRIGNDLDVKIHGLLTRLFDAHGLGSVAATKKFLKWADEYDPDLVWLHNIHGYYINYELLFAWIKKRPAMEVKWTLHDCWAFTGHCAHFSFAKCEKWKYRCHHCVQKMSYPASWLLDRCKNNYDRKNKAFTGVSNLTLVTPSEWLAKLVKCSFLKNYPVIVYHNKIDLSIFKPTQGNFRNQYNLNDETIILGVASSWDERKGLKDFIKLSKMLDEKYAIVLVGLSDKQIDKISNLEKSVKSNNLEPIKNDSIDPIFINKRGMLVPQKVEAIYKAIKGKPFFQEPNSKAKMILLNKTTDSGRLAEIYTAADFFVNPTYEDNYPTVNLEAIACGTFVISYDSGGCKETLE